MTRRIIVELCNTESVVLNYYENPVRKCEITKVNNGTINTIFCFEISYYEDLETKKSIALAEFLLVCKSWAIEKKVSVLSVYKDQFKIPLILDVHLLHDQLEYFRDFAHTGVARKALVCQLECNPKPENEIPYLFYDAVVDHEQFLSVGHFPNTTFRPDSLDKLDEKKKWLLAIGLHDLDFSAYANLSHKVVPFAYFCSTAFNYYYSHKAHTLHKSKSFILCLTHDGRFVRLAYNVFIGAAQRVAERTLSSGKSPLLTREIPSDKFDEILSNYFSSGEKHYITWGKCSDPDFESITLRFGLRHSLSSSLDTGHKLLVIFPGTNSYEFDQVYRHHQPLFLGEKTVSTNAISGVCNYWFNYENVVDGEMPPSVWLLQRAEGWQVYFFGRCSQHNPRLLSIPPSPLETRDVLQGNLDVFFNVIGNHLRLEKRVDNEQQIFAFVTLDKNGPSELRDLTYQHLSAFASEIEYQMLDKSNFAPSTCVIVLVAGLAIPIVKEIYQTYLFPGLTEAKFVENYQKWTHNGNSVSPGNFRPSVWLLRDLSGSWSAWFFGRTPLDQPRLSKRLEYPEEKEKAPSRWIDFSKERPDEKVIFGERVLVGDVALDSQSALYAQRHEVAIDVLHQLVKPGSVVPLPLELFWRGTNARNVVEFKFSGIDSSLFGVWYRVREFAAKARDKGYALELKQEEIAEGQSALFDLFGFPWYQSVE